MSTREAATVTSVWYGVEDHGLLTSWLYMQGDWGCQGFGGLCLKNEAGPLWKSSLCSVFGVRDFEDIKGRQCFILRSWPDYGSSIEGVEVDGLRFTITAFQRQVSPERKWDPLDQKSKELRSRIDSAGRTVQTAVHDLERVTEGYVDWTAQTGSVDVER